MTRRTGHDLLRDLTPAQVEAVTHFEGPLLILAGAGSGKTRVLTRRVAWLLDQGVSPFNILAITFTNKAAGEMRSRVEALVPGSRVWISTFHSFGARLLRIYSERFGLDRDFTIYDVDDRNKMVKDAVEAADLDVTRFRPEALAGAISKAKNQLLTSARFVETAGDFFRKIVAQVYDLYEKRMREANALDFDDLLLWPALALKNDEVLRQELDQRFRFVLIDEYQDTNVAQYEIARGLSQSQPNLCVVGDGDQSIYRWRGSDIRNILNFERDYPGAKVITLTQNYRSTKTILAAADALIAHNKHRKPKTLTTDNPAGRPVGILTFDTGADEAEQVVRAIKSAHDERQRPYRDFAIFLRINALSRTLESAFVKHGVPFQIVRGLAFFERKENKDVLAYLRLILNPQDDLSFLRAIGEPPRGVGDTSLKHLKTYAAQREISLLSASADVAKLPQIRGKAAAGLRDFYRLIHGLREHLDAPPHELIRLVLDRSGYRAMLQTSDDDDQERLANIEELLTAARQFTAEDGSRTARDFLEQVTLASDTDGWDETSDMVSVMTLHASKGLEFPIVYMLAVEQGLLPHERSLQQLEELEEERRLCYVGMTRAKEELYLCHAKLREFRGQALYAVPSMFLQEIPAEHCEAIDRCRSSGGTPRWADDGPAPFLARPSAANPSLGYDVGSVVTHFTYGRGKVTHLSGHGATRRVKVRFDGHGEKIFIADKVKLTVIG